MMPGRFFLGVGTGEALNEHITGERWPETDVRQEMLEEAIEIMRLLWQGGNQSYHGLYYEVENARLYTLPEQPVAVMIAAGGPSSAELAGRLGDGFIGTSPDKEVIQAFEAAGGKGPRYGQMTVCWNEDEATALKTAHEIWPNAGLPGELGQELPTPAHFAQAEQLVTPEKIAESVVVGPDQEGFIRFAEREILPRFAAARERAA